MSGAEEEEEKKKERRRAEEVFLFPDVKERRAPNSDRQVSVVSVRKNTEAVRDDEQDHLSALFMIAALHNEKLLPPPPSVSPSSHSVYPPLYQLPSHHFILSLHGAILKRRVRLGLDCFLFLFLFRESRRTASGSRRRHSRNSFCLAPPIEPQRHLKRSQRNQAAVKMFRISFIEKYRLFCITRRKKQRP